MRYERRQRVIGNVYAVEPVAPETVSEMRFHKRINDMADKALKEINGAVTEAKVRLKIHHGPILEGTVPNDVFARLDNQLFWNRQNRLNQNYQNQFAALASQNHFSSQLQAHSGYMPLGGVFGGIFRGWL